MFLTPFIFGVLAATLALIVELVSLNLEGTISYSPLLLNFSSVWVLLATALIEEGARFLLLFQYFRRFASRETSSWRATLFTGIMFGLGFVSLEAALLLRQGSFPIAALSGIAFVHLTTSLLYAAGLGRKLPLAFMWVFVCGVLFHLSYNVLLVLTP